jgi:GT2 family glycosyltransferase
MRSSRRIERVRSSDENASLRDRLSSRRFGRVVPSAPSTLTALRRLGMRHSRVSTFLERALRRFPALEDAAGRTIRGNAQERYARWTRSYDTLTDADMLAMREFMPEARQRPALSVLVPIGHADTSALEMLADSLVAQVYDSWEAVFLVTVPLDATTSAFASGLPSRDARFNRVVHLDLARAEAWKEVFLQADSDFVVLAHPTVTLRPHALLLMVAAIEREPGLALIYGDDDSLDEAGSRRDHYFKPDWNEALLRCQNYIGELLCVRRSLAAGAARHEDVLDDGNWGLLLRLAPDVSPTTARHIPFVLSHKRNDVEAGAMRRGELAAALQRRLVTQGEPADVKPAGKASYTTRYAVPVQAPLVSVIVPTTGRLDLLRPCVDGVLKRTAYPHVEVIVVAHDLPEQSADESEYLEEIQKLPRVSTLFTRDSTFNFSRSNNLAASIATGELLCFLNDDTEVVAADWLSAMTGHLLREHVGAVGAKLLYPNGRIQHAGVILGAGGVAAHSYKGARADTGGYQDRAVVDQDVSCVTAACMLVRREAFSDVGGFDEDLAVAFNDVDLCLRLRAAGWRIVWTPSAQLYHKESVSIGPHHVTARQSQCDHEWDITQRRWAAQLRADPFYNPNLSLDAWQLWEPAFPPRVSYPWRGT